MSEEQEHEPLTDDEHEAKHSGEIPEREAMSVLGLSVDPPEPPPDV